MLFIFIISYLEKKYRYEIKAINTLTAFYYLQKTRYLYYLKSFVLNIKLKQNIKLLFVSDLLDLLNSISIKYKAI